MMKLSSALALVAMSASTVSAQLKISEVVAKAELGAQDWVEFQNLGTAEVALKGMYVQDAGANRLELDDVTVAPNAFHVQKLPLTAAFGFGKADTVELYTSTPSLIDSVSWKTGESPVGYSWSRCVSEADKTTVYYRSAAVTEGEANDCAELPLVPQEGNGSLRINEIKNLNVTLNDVDWVELYNPGTVATKMKGWTMSDETKAYIGRYQFPDDLEIAAGGYHVVELDETTPFRLGANDAVYLFDGMAELVHETSWTDGFLAVGNTLAACSQADRPDVMFQIIEGTGTKGAANGDCVAAFAAGESPIVFNEINANGTDWVEFYNKGTNAVDVSQWRFSDGDFRYKNRVKVGSTPDGLNNKVMQPGEYHLVTLGNKDFGFNPENAEEMILFNPSGVMAQYLSGWDTTNSPQSGATYALCDGEYRVTSSPTPGAENVCVDVPPRGPDGGAGTGGGAGTDGDAGTDGAAGTGTGTSTVDGDGATDGASVDGAPTDPTDDPGLNVAGSLRVGMAVVIAVAVAVAVAALA